jgi:hypothetical protein
MPQRSRLTPSAHQRSSSSRGNSWRDWLTAGTERFALVSALLYALGYLARSLHAFDYNFGALPGARLEYLVAGLFLSLPILLFVLTVWAFLTTLRRLSEWAPAHLRAHLPWLTPLSSIVFLIALAVSVIPAVRSTWLIASLWVSVVLLALLVGVASPSEHTTERAESMRPASSLARASGRVSHAMERVLVWLFAGSIYLALLWFLVAGPIFGAVLLAKWPQEFGGVQPKCAVLDLATDQLSSEMASLLIASATPVTGAPPVVRSIQVQVYSTAGPWLVRTRGPNDSSAHPRSLRIPDQAVRTVEWVSKGTPGLADASKCATR